MYKLLKRICKYECQNIGVYTPAELEVFTNGGLSFLEEKRASYPNDIQEDRNFPIPLNSFSVHIHHLPGHWVTSCVFPSEQSIFVYDSLQSEEHKREVEKQLKHIYGNQPAFIQFVNVQQQNSDPICGLMAIAFAVSCCFGDDPATQKYNLSELEPHLKSCILAGKLKRFPLLYESYPRQGRIYDVSHVLHILEKIIKYYKEMTYKNI